MSAEGVRPEELKIRVVMDWPEPKTVKYLQGFLGLAYYFNRYIEGFATMAAPLYDRTRGMRGKTRIYLSSDEIEAFEGLKRVLVTPSLLPHPRLDEQFVLQTDGSKVAIGAVLLQAKPDGTERPLGYYSYKLSKAEGNYAAYKLECLAVYRSVKHFRVYLLAREFTIRTDHQALKWLAENEPDESILNRWLTELQYYRFRD